MIGLEPDSRENTCIFVGNRDNLFAFLGVDTDADHLNDLGLGRSCEHALEFPRGNEILQVRVRVNQLGHWLSLR